MSVETIPFAEVTIRAEESWGIRVLTLDFGDGRGTVTTSSNRTALAMAAKGALSLGKSLAVAFESAEGAGCEDAAALAALVAEPCLIVVERWAARYLILPVRAGVVDYG